ncbi:hypothetical protein FRC03_000366 [Tulasnella sp. 419]|nr:hypothetical protein FRC03_000366 [Tulasnella sp. 419]
MQVASYIILPHRRADFPVPGPPRCSNSRRLGHLVETQSRESRSTQYLFQNFCSLYQKLQMRGAHFMEHGLYSNMRTLRFSPYNHGAPFNIKDYHDLLLSSPNLEEISILGVSSYSAPTFQIADAFQVSMPHLRSIEFHFLPWKAILALMSSIHVVADASRPITASAWILQDPNPVIFPKVSESQSLLSTILTSDWLSPSSELDLKGDTLSLRFGSDSEPSVTLALQRDFIRPGNIMSHMIGVGCLPRVKILETKGIGLFPAAESQWNGVSLPCLEILKIPSPWEDTRLFRRTIIPLSSPGSSSEDTSWIFPKLRYCAFDTLVDGELLKDLIEGRGRDEDGVPLSSNLPSGLELVELSNRNKMLHGESIIAHSTKHNVKLRYRDLSIW